jgi:hypothetical protein
MSLTVVNIASKTGNKTMSKAKAMTEIRRAISLAKKGVVLV